MLVAEVVAEQLFTFQFSLFNFSSYLCKQNMNEEMNIYETVPNGR